MGEEGGADVVEMGEIMGRDVSASEADRGRKTGLLSGGGGGGGCCGLYCGCCGGWG